MRVSVDAYTHGYDVQMYSVMQGICAWIHLYFFLFLSSLLWMYITGSKKEREGVVVKKGRQEEDVKGKEYEERGKG